MNKLFFLIGFVHSFTIFFSYDVSGSVLESKDTENPSNPWPGGIISPWWVINLQDYCWPWIKNIEKNKENFAF